MQAQQLGFPGCNQALLRPGLRVVVAAVCFVEALSSPRVSLAESTEANAAQQESAVATDVAPVSDALSMASTPAAEAAGIAVEKETAAGGVSWGQFLGEVSPAIAKVGCKKRWFTGFVFHSRKHVITTRDALNNECDLSVRFHSGKPHAARPVAWSDADGLVLLELSEPAPAQPLTLTADFAFVPEVGARMAIVASTTDFDSANHSVDAWLPARLRFGVVSALQKPELLLDLPLSLADLGAPVFAPDGKVFGIAVSAYAVGGPTRVVTGQALQRLLKLVGTQGEFSRSYPFGWTEGVLATPYSSRGLLGASIHMGPTYRWLALVLHAGIYQAGERRVSAAASEQQSALRAEAELTARIHGQPGAYSLVGAGVAYESLATEHRLLDQDAHTTHKRRWRPFISALAGYWTGQFRFSAYPGPDPELRLEIGFTQGR